MGWGNQSCIRGHLGSETIGHLVTKASIAYFKVHISSVFMFFYSILYYEKRANRYKNNHFPSECRLSHLLCPFSYYMNNEILNKCPPTPYFWYMLELHKPYIFVKGKHKNGTKTQTNRTDFLVIQKNGKHIIRN